MKQNTRKCRTCHKPFKPYLVGSREAHHCKNCIVWPPRKKWKPEDFEDDAL